MTSIPTHFSNFGKATVLAIAVASTAVIGVAPTSPALAHKSRQAADLVDTAAKSKKHKTNVNDSLLALPHLQAQGRQQTILDVAHIQRQTRRPAVEGYAVARA